MSKVVRYRIVCPPTAVQSVAKMKPQPASPPPPTPTDGGGSSVEDVPFSLKSVGQLLVVYTLYVVSSAAKQLQPDRLVKLLQIKLKHFRNRSNLEIDEILREGDALMKAYKHIDENVKANAFNPHHLNQVIFQENSGINVLLDNLNAGNVEKTLTTIINQLNHSQELFSTQLSAVDLSRLQLARNPP